VLDGGHMVFLVWEAITRRRPSEKVLIGATYAGMAFLLCLMMLVLYLDIFEHRLGFGR
jgi:regulator of sigma E protease